MASFTEALSKVILNLISLSVHVPANVVAGINCLSLIFKAEIDQLSHHIF